MASIQVVSKCILFTVILLTQQTLEAVVNPITSLVHLDKTVPFFIRQGLPTTVLRNQELPGVGQHGVLKIRP